MDNDQLATFLASVAEMSVEKKVKLFVKTREAKAAAQKAFDTQDAQFKAIQETVENMLLADADKAGVTGFTTPFGTTYTAETAKISIADDSAFFGFVKAQGDLDFFERRVSSKHVTEYMKLSDGVAPPGLNIFRERVMRVRKASEKS